MPTNETSISKTANESVELIHLSINRLFFSYDGLPIIKDFSLTLGNGQIGCLLGPSGCGKSTLLRTIAGFETVTSGEIRVSGELYSSKKLTVAPENRQIGMVFQDLALFPHLTIAENITFGLRGWTESKKIQRTHNLLDLFDLSGMGPRYPHSLSGGQQQRVALARAMASRPKLLLLDEPFSGLDASLKESLVPEIREILLQEGISVLLVTHDQREAFAIADKVAVMNAGTLLQIDTPYNIYHEPKNPFVANFVGEGDFLTGIVLDKHRVQSSLGVLHTKKPHHFAKEQAVRILVRPDDLLHDDDSSFTAKIVSKQFRGSHFLYRVQLSSQQRLYCLASSHHNHGLGEDIGIKLDVDHLVMFEESQR